MHFPAIPAGKCPADKGLALPGMVGPGRIDIIHAVVDGVPEHLRCEGLVDFSVRRHWQAHAAEAEDGEVLVVHFPVEHGCSHLVPDTDAMGDKGDGEWKLEGIWFAGKITLAVARPAERNGWGTGGCTRGWCLNNSPGSVRTIVHSVRGQFWYDVNDKTTDQKGRIGASGPWRNPDNRDMNGTFMGQMRHGFF